MMPATPPSVDTGALLRLADAAELEGRLGACQHPITLTGQRLLVDADTGQILSRLDPAGTHATVRCRSRRAAVCPTCSALYRLDAYHLIAAGLRGGKATPDAVATRPRLFVTLTAPSFGPVHLGPDRDGGPRCCHPRRCGRWHRPGDPLIGSPIDAARYDYVGQVLFNAHVGLLWARLCIDIRRALADAAGVSRTDAAAMVRVVFAKVAEFRHGVWSTSTPWCAWTARPDRAPPRPAGRPPPRCRLRSVPPPAVPACRLRSPGRSRPAGCASVVNSTSNT